MTLLFVFEVGSVGSFVYAVNVVFKEINDFFRGFSFLEMKKSGKTKTRTVTFLQKSCFLRIIS